MYTQFTQTEDNGYLLKKQGVLSLILVGGALLALTIFLFMAYFKDPANKSMLYFGLVILFFACLVFLRYTGKFIIYPKQKIMKYSLNSLYGAKEFTFDEYDGISILKTKNQIGLTVGVTFNLRFNKNGKNKEIQLGHNVSAKKQRIIAEEIHQIMNQG